MKLSVGLKFKIFYNDNNINNIDCCEVRGIVDDYIIVLWCERQATKRREYAEFYLTIDKTKFDYNVKDGNYIKI